MVLSTTVEILSWPDSKLLVLSMTGGLRVRKFISGAVAVAGATVAFTAGFGSGVAQADDPLVGKSYADASGMVGDWGGTAIISTVVGSRVATDDCIVTNWHKDTNDNSRVMLALNCNAGVATATAPGNSVVSTAGRQAAKKQAEVEWRSENPEWCAEMWSDHPEWGELEGCTY
jgi:hypothetical protein